MYKKIVLFLSLIFLASCSNSDKIFDWENATEFSWSGFSVKIPESWTSTGSQNLPSINNGSVVFSAISNEKKNNFSNNFLIISEKLEHIWSSIQYSEINNRSTSKKYSEYSLVKTENFIFPDSDDGKYYIFDARYNSNTPKLRFIQTAKMCGTTVFLLNSTISLDSDFSKIINIFKTFKCQ